MKTLKLALIGLALSFGQMAAASSPINPVLQIQVSQGMMPVGLVSQKVTIMDGGIVTVEELHREYHDDGTTTDTTKHYTSDWYETPETMDKIYTAIRQVTGGKLVDQQPGKPKYADGAFVAYSAFVDGQQRVFSRSNGGHDYLPANRAEHRAARYLRADLDALLKAVKGQ